MVDDAADAGRACPVAVDATATAINALAATRILSLRNQHKRKCGHPGHEQPSTHTW